MCGGTTYIRAASAIYHGLSPRVRGTWAGDYRGRAQTGLSPRVRGNPGAVGAAAGGERSIPACAGEPG